MLIRNKNVSFIKYVLLILFCLRSYYSLNGTQCLGYLYKLIDCMRINCNFSCEIVRNKWFNNPLGDNMRQRHRGARVRGEVPRFRRNAANHVSHHTRARAKELWQDCAAQCAHQAHCQVSHFFFRVAICIIFFISIIIFLQFNKTVCSPSTLSSEAFFLLFRYFFLSECFFHRIFFLNLRSSEWFLNTFFLGELLFFCWLCT